MCTNTPEKSIDQINDYYEDNDLPHYPFQTPLLRIIRDLEEKISQLEDQLNELQFGPE